MPDLSLTPGERRVLRELDGAPDKTLSYSTLSAHAYHYANLSSVGFGRVFSKLERRNMVSRNFADVALTFAGMRALAKEAA